jgi:hypothetical protein
VIPYSFHPEAEAELADAAVFYESRMVGLGKSFAAEVERTVSFIREHPTQARRSASHVGECCFIGFRT